MSVIDIIFRVDSICKKYDKYDIDRQRDLNAYGGDAYANLYSAIERDLESALRKSDQASSEKNRAASVALNAEIRRSKARMMEDILKLRKLAQKKVKGLSREDQETRGDLVFALAERIQSIPDGLSNAVKQSGGLATSGSNKNIKFDSSGDGQFDSGFFQQSKESSQFRQEYEMRKLKQDEGLDFISEGLDTLKDLAHDMNEELDRQVPLVDEIDTKVDRVTSDLTNTNVRLKQTLYQVRSSRNFCIDIVLVCIILGIGSYLYNILK